MRRSIGNHTIKLGIAAAVVLIASSVGQFSAGAMTGNPGCTDPTPYKWLPPGEVAPTNIDAAGLAFIAQQKMALDAQNPGLSADLEGAQRAGASPAEKQKWLSAAQKSSVGRSNQSMEAACKGTGAQRGSLFQRFQNSLGTDALAAGSTTYGLDYAWLNNLNQQGQICTPTCQQIHINYYCGPATVAEGTTTLAVGVSQGTAASYMGTTSAGTSNTQMVNGMVHFIGQPVFGWNFYGWVSVPWSPTQTDYNNYVYRLTGDISGTTAAPIAGDAYEVVDGPHLAGHPNQELLHWFETGGWNFNGHGGNTSYYTVYYADSATSVWATVPQYSWIGLQKVTIIMGGRGYVW